ncbi:hypothetical protein Q1695_013982 [Nippostrongylus brasiliensis]|nr:hypothetical protein Q1695_013982 [Nippostrongylus brasiliensis]
MTGACKKVSFACLLLIGVVSIVLGIVALTIIEGVVDKNVLQRDYLGYDVTNGTKRLNSMTKSWIRPQYHMQMQIWMYNLTNMEDVLKGAKPIVKEIGPFTFTERQWKSSYEFDKNDTRIWYRNNHVYVFNESLSCPNCSLNQTVIIPNVLFQKLVDFADMGFMQKFAIEAALTFTKTETPFINVSVREALYDGYKDPLLDVVCNKPVLKAQNNTDDGLYEISTGLGNVAQIGKVHSYNNMSIMPETVWDSTDAREIHGSDGQLFPPFLKEGSNLEIFAGPICRSLVLEFRQRSQIQGVTAFRYGFPAKMYDPSVAENRGFCNKNATPTFFNSSVQIPGCLPKGCLDIGRCLPGSPRVYLSNSHFLHGNPELQSAIKGMDAPNELNDETYIDIEPTSGVPIHAKRVMQINVGMSKGKDPLRILSQMENIIFPVLWMNETIYFDSDTRNQLSGLTTIKHLVYVIGVSLLTAGLLVLFAVTVTVVLQTVFKPPADDEQPILQDDVVEEEVGEI